MNTLDEAINTMNTLLDKLLKDLKSSDETDRKFAAEDLGDLKDPAAVRPLINALQDSIIAVREAATDALVAIGDETVCREVIPLLGSEDASLRNYAIEILAKLGPEAAHSLVTKLYNSPSSDIKKFILDILGRMGKVVSKEAFEAIVASLDEENINVAVAAAEALGSIKDQAALPILAKYLKGPAWLQCNIIDAITRIGGDSAWNILISLNVTELSPEVRHFYWRAIDTMGVKGWIKV